MTYSSGGTIEASDFNGFNGGSAGANVRGQLNTVWGIGTGNKGYGQTTSGNVSVGNDVAASNWATLINNLNSSRKHQAGAGYTNLGVPTSGSQIDYLSTLSSRLNDAYDNRLTVNAYGSAQTKDTSSTATASASEVGSAFIPFSVTFTSSDQARYFFNAGGKIKVSYLSFTNNNGTARSANAQTLAQTCFGSKEMFANSYGAITGSGGGGGSWDYTTGNYGYYGGTVDAARLYSTSGTYTDDYLQYSVAMAGAAGSYGGKGNIITITISLYDGIEGIGGADDALNYTLTMRCEVFPPFTTYISNSWGTITLA